MNQHMHGRQVETSNNHQTKIQVLSLCAAIGLLLLTSYGNAGVMFWLSLSALFFLSVWFVLAQNSWLALISTITFLFGFFAFAKSLY